MLTKRTLAFIGLSALLSIAALVKYRSDTSDRTGAEQTTTVSSTAEAAPASDVLDNHVSPAEAAADANRPRSAQEAESASIAVSADPVYLESTGVIERLQKSRHGFFAPVIKGVPQRPTFRFTLERQPLAELASQQATVAWPVNDGGVEFVKLNTLREQDGNLFISGEVVDGRGQFVMVMTRDNSMSGHLLSPRGMYSYNSQLDEIVGQRVEEPMSFD